MLNGVRSVFRGLMQSGKVFYLMRKEGVLPFLFQLKPVGSSEKGVENDELIGR